MKKAFDYFGSACKGSGFTALRRELRSNGNLALNVAHGWQRLQVVVGLHDQPGRGIATKVLGQSSRCIGSDGAAFFDDLVNTSCGNAKRNRKGVYAETERSQVVFAQNLTRMNRAHTMDQTCHVASFR